MALDKEVVEPRPGMIISTPSGLCALLYPERAGHPEGNWIGVLLSGYAVTVTQEEISGQVDTE